VLLGFAIYIDNHTRCNMYQMELIYTAEIGLTSPNTPAVGYY
jgi:hypothetical protein